MHSEIGTLLRHGFWMVRRSEMAWLSGGLGLVVPRSKRTWPAAGSEDTELGVLMEPEVCHGATEVYARVQA